MLVKTFHPIETPSALERALRLHVSGEDWPQPAAAPYLKERIHSGERLVQFVCEKPGTSRGEGTVSVRVVRRRLGPGRLVVGPKSLARLLGLSKERVYGAIKGGVLAVIESKASPLRNATSGRLHRYVVVDGRLARFVAPRRRWMPVEQVLLERWFSFDDVLEADAARHIRVRYARYREYEVWIGMDWVRWAVGQWPDRRRILEMQAPAGQTSRQAKMS